MGIERVGIVGGGQMGAGIAEVCAKAGIDVVVHEISDVAAAASRARIEKSLSKAVERGKLDASGQEDALARLAFGTDLAAMHDRQLVVEAVVENEELKQGIFRQLDDIVGDDDAILASNTSSIPIVRIAQATDRPESVVGMHFFNPATVMPLVEIVRSVVSDDSTVERAAAFAADTLGKTVVHAKDRAGFIVNLLLCPYIIDAIRMYEEGFASKEDIDAAMVNGANYPMGPLALSDLIGNDTMLAVMESLFEEFRQSRFAPPPLLKRMVEAGHLGRKTGRGFYDY
ncbi:MAG TPA: 3-hydroxybutyryl-CoA dehydrogenase [Acidimicrobiia bacterium]|jgi:3-hydroxybutyryl-CoA dehydrogenase|nr:3-hydroxybutyryl-CoA dehydrogenase [Acidimicrobiia bacterium]